MKRTNHKRRYTGTSQHRPDNKKFRQEEAKERQAAYDALSNTEKIAMLDRKLGEGVGAKKQRARLVAKPPPDTLTSSRPIHGGALIPESR